jgi:hypothetical protein
MIKGKKYQDTPSILHRQITTIRKGASLKYAELSGREKRDYLFEEGIRPTAYDNYPDEERPEVFTGIVQFGRSALKSIKDKLLNDSLTRVSDELEAPKPKLFHTYGTTAKIVFTPEPDTPYTGIFREKAHGLARFSYAGPVLGIGVVPGLGLKFPVDGDHPSENVVVMRKLDRQQPLRHYFSNKKCNSVFQNAFTNILPMPRFINLIMRTVNKRFETVVEKGKGLHQPVDNLARVHTSGRAVAEEEVKFPHRIILVPTEQVRELSDPTIDFRDDLARNISAGTTIYTVLALSSSKASELNAKGIRKLEFLIPLAQKIGTIATESEFIASKYGDYRLFFKHSDRYLRKAFLHQET